MTITREQLAGVLDVFAENFSSRDELGASVSIWQHGQQLLTHSAGWCERERLRQWDSLTLVPFWSATKGLAATCVLHALHHSATGLDQPVAALWPEFRKGGKAGITFAQVLAHRGGLAALDKQIDSFDYPAVIAAIEAQAPNWPAGEAHGYHPRTFGYLLDEIVRRASGSPSLSAYWQEKFAEPLGLDLWISLPESEDRRVAKLYAGKMGETPGEEAFYRAFADPGSLTRRAFSSPTGIASITGMNDLRARRFGLPAMGGIGSAASLGKFYAVLAAGGRWEGQQFLAPAVLQQMERVRSNDLDKVFQLPTAFSAGFMKDPTNAFGEKRRRLFGPATRAFGHPGAGGSHAFADPENGIAFAYTMNQMSYGVLPNRRSLDMIAALYA